MARKPKPPAVLRVGTRQFTNKRGRGQPPAPESRMFGTVVGYMDVNRGVKQTEACLANDIRRQTFINAKKRHPGWWKFYLTLLDEPLPKSEGVNKRTPGFLR